MEELEKENKALLSENESLKKQLQELSKERAALIHTVEDYKEHRSFSNSATQARYYLTIKGLIDYIKSLNVLINSIQLSHAELQAQLVGLLKTTQPYFSQNIEDIVKSVSDAQRKMNDQLMDHSQVRQ